MYNEWAHVWRNTIIIIIIIITSEPAPRQTWITGES